MSLPVPNLESYNQQISAIQKQIDALSKSSQQFTPTQYNPVSAVQTVPIMQPVSAAPQISAMQIPSQIKYVDGLSGAKEFQAKMLDNSSEIVMDKNEDIFYVVSKDANGISPKSITIGHFTLEQEPVDEPIYMTKRDFESFKDEIRALIISNSAVVQTPVQPVIDAEYESAVADIEPVKEVERVKRKTTNGGKT